MATFPFKIDGTSFYASEEPNWQSYGVQDAYSVLGRPLPSGTGSFSITLRALPYVAQTGAGDPLQSSGTFYTLFGLYQTAIATTGGLQTFTTFDPRSNTYTDIKGYLNIAKLLADMSGGLARPDVTIEVNGAFVNDTARATYYGGDPVATYAPPYIPGDPLPDPDPLKTYGWDVGRWGYGYWTRGEGV